MAKIKKTTTEEKPKIELKKYTLNELKSWSNKFEGLHMNERGVIFGAYVSSFPDMYGKKIKSYAVRPYLVAEFDNLINQIDRMLYGIQKQDKQYDQMEHSEPYYSK